MGAEKSGSWDLLCLPEVLRSCCRLALLRGGTHQPGTCQDTKLAKLGVDAEGFLFDFVVLFFFFNNSLQSKKRQAWGMGERVPRFGRGVGEQGLWRPRVALARLAGISGCQEAGSSRGGLEVGSSLPEGRPCSPAAAAQLFPGRLLGVGCEAGKLKSGGASWGNPWYRPMGRSGGRPSVDLPEVNQARGSAGGCPPPSKNAGPWRWLSSSSVGALISGTPGRSRVLKITAPFAAAPGRAADVPDASSERFSPRRERRFSLLTCCNERLQLPLRREFVGLTA